MVRNGLKEAGQHLKTVAAKVSNIVNFVRKSVNASKILECEKKLQASNAMRWNNQLYMRKSILNVPEEKLNKTECQIQLSTYERKLLSELCTILGPFENVTILVQKENNIIASLTIPVTNASNTYHPLSTIKWCALSKRDFHAMKKKTLILLQPLSIQDSSLGGVKVTKLTMLNQMCAKTFKQCQYKMMKF